MSDPIFHQQIIPIPQPRVHELLTVYALTYEFRQEVQYREAFEEYCQWCYRMAEQHQREWEAMQKEVSFWNWLRRPGS